MLPWSKFLPHLVPSAQNCSDPQAFQALRESAREFFKRTRIWREWLDATTTRAGAPDYDFEIPAGTTVVRIERARLDGREIPILSPNCASNDVGVLSRDRVLFTLNRQATPGQQVLVEASLMPSRMAPGIPEELFEQHYQDIVQGAIARIATLPLFRDPEMARLASLNFEAAIASKAVEAWRGSTGNTPRARVRWI